MTTTPQNPVVANHPEQAASPPGKRDIKAWLKGFKLPSKHQDTSGTVPSSSSSPLHDHLELLASRVEDDMMSSLTAYTTATSTCCGDVPTPSPPVTEYSKKARKVASMLLAPFMCGRKLAPHSEERLEDPTSVTTPVKPASITAPETPTHAATPERTPELPQQQSPPEASPTEEAKIRQARLLQRFRRPTRVLSMGILPSSSSPAPLSLTTVPPTFPTTTTTTTPTLPPPPPPVATTPLFSSSPSSITHRPSTPLPSTPPRPSTPVPVSPEQQKRSTPPEDKQLRESRLRQRFRRPTRVLQPAFVPSGAAPLPSVPYSKTTLPPELLQAASQSKTISFSTSSRSKTTLPPELLEAASRSKTISSPSSFSKTTLPPELLAASRSAALLKAYKPKPEPRPDGIFGVPLRQSIPYANVAISLVDDDGKSYIYGYVPIVVAKCGVFLKEKGTGIEGIFRLSGSEKRIKELKQSFDSPDRYGKGLVWDGYTVHDAANVFRRYLNELPEPVVPLDLYEKFREPLRGSTKQVVGVIEGAQLAEGFDPQSVIPQYQKLIAELPPLNRQLLLYILDLLAVFAAKSDENKMNSQNLAAIFQPGMLSHPDHAMAPEEYRLNQCVIIFLIENQDHFTVQEVQQEAQQDAGHEPARQETRHEAPREEAKKEASPQPEANEAAPEAVPEAAPEEPQRPTSSRSG